MDHPVLPYGRLHSGLRPGSTGAELGGDLRELLSLDVELWEAADDDAVTPPLGQPRRGDVGSAEGGAYAPAGLCESALPLPGREEKQFAEDCAEDGRAHVCSHPLWSVLVDYYFACRKVRTPCCESRDCSRGRRMRGNGAVPY